MENSATPLLFGTPGAQRYLLRIHALGYIPRCDWQNRVILMRSGILCRTNHRSTGKEVWTFDKRHPAYADLWETLRRISGVEGRTKRLPPPAAPLTVHPESPLGHKGYIAFRILQCVAAHGGSVSIERLRKELSDSWGTSVHSNLASLVRDGVLVKDSGVVRFTPEVPAAYQRAIMKIGDALSAANPRLHVPEKVASTPAAFGRASDGAPLLFGTDRRFRNLMAISKYGPMYWRDVRPLVAGSQNKLEQRDHAPFGRGDIVRVWETEHGPAVMIDPDYPLAAPLIRLLLKMERFWPVGAYAPKRPLPEPPPRLKWVGDRHALLGGPIRTQVLATIGVLGWTFEALCCEVLKYDRVTVKKGILKLEEKDKLLVGDRPRGPGFKVRRLDISDDFPAKAELMDLLRAFVQAWPDYGDRVRDKIERLHPKTKAHLRKRGLL